MGQDLTFHGAAFVAKVNPGGTALVYAGYIGGTGLDEGRGIAVDGAGNAYITGFTDSTEASFPVTVGPDLTFNGGSFDAFVAKVSPGGTALVYAGYIGGTGLDAGQGIAVDKAGNAYVTGETGSAEASFPVTVGPDLTFNGLSDAFVAKVNPGGTALVYAGYIGGAGTDVGLGIAADNSGNAYVTGSTESTELSFPVTVGPDLTDNDRVGQGLTEQSRNEVDLHRPGGVSDAFVAKVNPGGTALVYAGYIGGAGTDVGLGIAADNSGNAYVTGSTESTEASFPVTAGPDLTFNGFVDAFVAKVAMPHASTITTVSAASFLGPLLTPNCIASGFGSNLATATEAATSVPLPTTLAGTTVTVTDTMGTARLAQLFFVSPGQINYLIPEGTAIGLATVTVTSADGSTVTGPVEIVVVAPGFFTANATGEGVAAASYLRVAANGTRTQDLIFDPNTRASVPIDLGSESDEIFLLLFGTGIRGFTSQVTATVGGENVPVLSAVAQGQFVGLDQVNVGPLPRSLAGRGEVDIILTADGKQANTVTVNIQAESPSFFFADRVGDVFSFPGAVGPVTDLLGLVFIFDNATGAYKVIITASSANPFIGDFRFNLNLFNPNTGSTATEFFTDQLNDFSLSTPSTSITLTGSDAKLLAWQAGDQVAACEGPGCKGGLGQPSGVPAFGSGVINFQGGLPPSGQLIARDSFQSSPPAMILPDDVTLSTGDLDAVFANGCRSAQSCSRNRVCVNDSSGGFTCSDVSTDTKASAVALGDVDGDSDLDAVFANDSRNRVCVNDGSGGFTCSDVSTGTGLAFDFTYDVALGDVDGDSDLDAVFAKTFYNRVCLNDASGGFTCSDVSTDLNLTFGVALGDVDGDGDLDAVFANTRRSRSSSRNRVCVNDGSGGFTCSDVSTDTNSTLDVALGDVDGDSDLDTVFANSDRNRVCLGDGSGNFTCSDVSTDTVSTAVGLGDVDGDNDLDAVFASGLRNLLCVNDGSGNFTCSDVSTDTNRTVDVALGDVDGDNDLDAVFANQDISNRVCLGDGSGNFTCSDVSTDRNVSVGVALGDVRRQLFFIPSDRAQ